MKRYFWDTPLGCSQTGLFMSIQSLKSAQLDVKHLFLMHTIQFHVRHRICLSITVMTVKKSDLMGQYLIRHTLAVLFGGVDQRLVQIHHQDQLFVPVESLLVFSAQLFGLLLERIKITNRESENVSNKHFVLQ